jgi:3-oxoacyl-[acyl-carrier protein] reductase
MHNIVVTGGSRGLGFGIACTLAGSGYRVVAIARNKSEQLDCAMQQTGRHGALHFLPFDLGELSGIPKLVKDIKKEFGPIYGLVNNAAIGIGGLLSMMPDHQIERLVRLNTISPIVLTKHVVRTMMTSGAGRIINIASIVSFRGFNGLTVYAATKASVVGFTRSLARELGPLEINVNAVAPGFVDTDMTEGLEGTQREQVIRRSSLRRLAEVDDVANAVEFLLSDRARNITGTTLTVDAGTTA